jgi:hypothetical protein
MPHAADSISSDPTLYTTLYKTAVALSCVASGDVHEAQRVARMGTTCGPRKGRTNESGNSNLTMPSCDMADNDMSECKR